MDRQSEVVVVKRRTGKVGIGSRGSRLASRGKEREKEKGNQTLALLIKCNTIIIIIITFDGSFTDTSPSLKMRSAVRVGSNKNVDDWMDAWITLIRVD